MSDDRDFIARSDSISGNLYGEPMSPDRITDDFALYGARSRVAALERFDGELHGKIDSGSHSLRRHVVQRLLHPDWRDRVPKHKFGRMKKQRVKKID
jgi:hypothetical protein